jgi:hypothetical protein
MSRRAPRSGLIAAALITALAFNWSTTVSASSAKPFSSQALSALPAGTFYMTVGTRADSYDIWQFDRRGIQRRLTSTQLHYGISVFSASRAGIVALPTGGGVSQLARLTSRGLVGIASGNTGHALDATVNASGQIAILTAPYRSHPFLLGVKSGWSASPKWIASSSSFTGFSGAQIESNGDVVTVRNPDQGQTGGANSLVQLWSDGKWRLLGRQMRNLGEASLSPGGRLLALKPWAGGDVIEALPSEQLHLLPAGWNFQAWSPIGTQMLVERAGQLGLVTVGNYAHVRVVALFNGALGAGQISWLTGAAQT